MSVVYPYKISVIIVNYNVEFFLEQCLYSVQKALKNVSGEVFVVDNHSKDGSVQMVRDKFPTYTLIANEDNRGFSKANNQAIAKARGEYILLLNPDTVIEEDTLEQVVHFMDTHADAGGLGVKMVDGKGNFLPESKRGLPTPAVAFYKIFGLSKLFPKSKRFGRYHLGYLDESEINEIDILSGAFMLMRHKVLDKIGWLDETFFMYGEDIDLSYRITRAGYKNYYYPHTNIIHYKGESTKKSSINYIFVFYRAMIIFARKHFAKKNAKTFSFLIHMAIYLRALLAICSRISKRLFPPLFDFIFLFGIFFSLSMRWEPFFALVPWGQFSLYAFIWVLATIFCRVYSLPVHISTLLIGVGWGSFWVYSIHFFSPKFLQLPHLLIVGFILCTFGYYLVSRCFMHLALGRRSSIFFKAKKRFAIVGTPNETRRITRILKRTFTYPKTILLIDPKGQKSEHLDRFVRQHKLDELIFCPEDSSYKECIAWIKKMTDLPVHFKMAMPGSSFLVGSNSTNKPGDFYHLEHYAITETHNKLNKRTLDIVVAILACLIAPLSIWFFKHKKQYIKNLFHVLIGRYSWVGYARVESENLSKQLPKLRRGVMPPIIQHADKIYIAPHTINERYAKKYSFTWEVLILLYSWKKMDNLVGSINEYRKKHEKILPLHR